MPTSFLRALVVVVLVLPTAALADAITNGGLETGTLSGWTLAGSGSAQTSSIGVTPTAGTYQGYIETTGNFTVSANAVATSLGFSDATIIDGLAPAPATNGSAISQSITVAAGDVLSFDWNFLTSELDQSPVYNDYAFFTISGSAYLLASRNSSTYNTTSPPSGFQGQTGWATQTYTFTTSGTYLLGFGTLNATDSGHNSALLLDAITIPQDVSAVPVPSAAWSLPVLMAIVFALKCKHRRASASKSAD